MSHSRTLVALLALVVVFGVAHPPTGQAGRACALGGPSAHVHGCFRPRARAAVVAAAPAPPVPTITDPATPAPQLYRLAS
jgi:hypothetical protein